MVLPSICGGLYNRIPVQTASHARLLRRLLFASILGTEEEIRRKMSIMLNIYLCQAAAASQNSEEFLSLPAQGCHRWKMKAETFSLSIRLDKAKNLHNLLPIPPDDDENVIEAWLSYRLLDATLIQTEKFEIYATRTEGFEANEDLFKLELPATGNLTAALSKSFDVYLCTHGSILGRLEVNISRLLTLNEGGDQFAERAGRGTFYFATAANGKEDASSIEVSMSLRPELNDDIATDVGSSNSSSSSRTCKLEATTTTTSCQTLAQHPKAAPLPTQTQTPSPSTRTTGTTADDRIEFEKERRRWEEWRHKEELKWHNKMRERESAALKALDEQSKAQERENAKEIDAKKKEFESLEGRLRKALAEVEKRERRIRTVEASREAEYTTKMAEVELKQKLLKEETKHAAELEVS